MLVSKAQLRAVTEAAALFGLSRSAWLRSLALRGVESAHNVRPSIGLPEREDDRDEAEEAAG